jgi:hypothetical protein
MMKITSMSIGITAVLLFTFAGSLAASGRDPAADRLGTWSSVSIGKGEDHASGIEIELWRKGGQVFGFMSEHNGPAADPPVGKLESIRWDEKSGAISFTSKLSVGVDPAPEGGAWVPSKNLYEFNGTIGKKGITGTLRRKFVNDDGSSTAYDEDLTLAPKSPDGGATAGESFDDWTKRWNEALKKRGPKW